MTMHMAKQMSTILSSLLQGGTETGTSQRTGEYGVLGPRPTALRMESDKIGQAKLTSIPCQT